MECRLVTGELPLGETVWHQSLQTLEDLSPTEPSVVFSVGPMAADNKYMLYIYSMEELTQFWLRRMTNSGDLDDYVYRGLVPLQPAGKSQILPHGQSDIRHEDERTIWLRLIDKVVAPSASVMTRLWLDMMRRLSMFECTNTATNLLDRAVLLGFLHDGSRVDDIEIEWSLSLIETDLSIYILRNAEVSPTTELAIYDNSTMAAVIARLFAAHDSCGPGDYEMISVVLYFDSFESYTRQLNKCNGHIMSNAVRTSFNIDTGLAVITIKCPNVNTVGAAVIGLALKYQGMIVHSWFTDCKLCVVVSPWYQCFLTFCNNYMLTVFVSSGVTPSVINFMIIGNHLCN